ncbi:MAG: ribonuclease HII [Deltaproteobacteria bacterium]|nr:ribonuclease HII [Deltaproteobacteria bacterium]
MDSFECAALKDSKKIIVGVDETGRGPLAGPVVASAVIYSKSLLKFGINDSKKLTEKKRNSLEQIIFKISPAVGVGIVWPSEVDSINVHNASLLAMRRAIKNTSLIPDQILIDGKFLIDQDGELSEASQRAIIKGDSRSVTIAAASVIAKTTRDSIMVAYHRLYPAYNFPSNKGYPTAEHRSAVKKFGRSPIHRKTFRVS